ncbi:hypothetical protein BD410DRAFT_794395 [Rickenella mellea]|uniref:WW domain-containing protein n=1 Tax=Rickenella mellea TaxID=50990 RepID=A0A4Y7PPF1_9AGAM|nr:hypothetical protein BD410DRAFT_794395 [Rickenella mellea]
MDGTFGTRRTAVLSKRFYERVHVHQTTTELSYRPFCTSPTLPTYVGIEEKSKTCGEDINSWNGLLRVKTNEGNTFYTNKAKKESVWTVPEEIKEAVNNLEKEEAAAEAKKLEDEQRARESAEVDRVTREVDEVIAKRKAEEPQPMDEIIASKKARVEDAEEDEDEEGGDESEEEEWQKEAAARMAAKAEEDARRQEEEAKFSEEEVKKAEKELKKKAAAKGTQEINMPARVDLSIEEAKALFKARSRVP